MHILRVTRAYPPDWDGAANHVVGLSRQQARAKHRVWVFQPHPTDVSDDSTTVTRVRLPHLLHQGIHESKASITAFHLRAAWFERRIHQDYDVDVLHVHGDALDAVLQAPVARLCGVPLVQTVHAGLSHRWLYRKTAPRLFRHVTRFIAVAQSVAWDLIALGIPEERITVISSGIDTGRFTRLARATSPHIVSIGRLHPAKGFVYLLDALRHLAQSGLTPPATIVGVGAQREKLERLAADLPHVRFAGAVPHEHIPRLLSSATLFVLPSVDLNGQTEGTPTALMEAMAAGLPIVTTDAGGITELIRDGVNGLLVPQRSAPALATAITALLQDESKRRHIGENNRTRAAEKDWAMIERQVATVYEAALRQYTRPGAAPH